MSGEGKVVDVQFSQIKWYHAGRLSAVDQKPDVRLSAQRLNFSDRQGATGVPENMTDRDQFGALVNCRRDPFKYRLVSLILSGRHHRKLQLLPLRHLLRGGMHAGMLTVCNDQMIARLPIDSPKNDVAAFRGVVRYGIRSGISAEL